VWGRNRLHKGVPVMGGKRNKLDGGKIGAVNGKIPSEVNLGANQKKREETSFHHGSRMWRPVVGGGGDILTRVEEEEMCSSSVMWGGSSHWGGGGKRCARELWRLPGGKERGLTGKKRKKQGSRGGNDAPGRRSLGNFREIQLRPQKLGEMPPRRKEGKEGKENTPIYQRTTKHGRKKRRESGHKMGESID